jgi:hypothetical protein
MPYAWRGLFVALCCLVHPGRAGSAALPVQASTQKATESEDRARMTHVRSSDPVVRRLLSEGVRRSTTLARLIARLDSSDVVVYVETNIRAVPGLGGYLSHGIVATARARYLTIAIRRPLDEERVVSLIAHELQHAVEISEDVAVRTSGDMAGLFRRIGGPACPGACYETEAARVIEYQVARELATRQP